MTIKFSFNPSFGYETKSMHAHNAPKKHAAARRGARNFCKVLGYMPGFGMVVGIGRVAQAIFNHKNLSGKALAGRIVRGGFEFCNVGIILLFADAGVTLYRHHSKSKTKDMPKAPAENSRDKKPVVEAAHVAGEHAENAREPEFKPPLKPKAKDMPEAPAENTKVNKEVIEEANNVEDPDEIAEDREPQIIVGTTNQYRQGGASACTRNACRFLSIVSKNEPASAQAIDDVLQRSDYVGNAHEDPEEAIARFDNLQVVENPWHRLQFTPEMQVNLTGRRFSLQAALQFILSDERVDGALVIARGETICLRKQGEMIEIFDSHGNAQFTHTDEPLAYVYRCQPQQLIHFFREKIPVMRDMGAYYNTVSFYPLAIRA